jgi:hypothetical protein
LPSYIKTYNTAFPKRIIAGILIFHKLRARPQLVLKPDSCA